MASSTQLLTARCACKSHRYVFGPAKLGSYIHYSCYSVIATDDIPTFKHVRGLSLHQRHSPPCCEVNRPATSAGLDIRRLLHHWRQPHCRDRSCCTRHAQHSNFMYPLRSPVIQHDRSLIRIIVAGRANNIRLNELSTQFFWLSGVQRTRRCSPEGHRNPQCWLVRRSAGFDVGSRKHRRLWGKS